MGTVFCLEIEHAPLLSHTPLLLHALSDRPWQHPTAKCSSSQVVLQYAWAQDLVIVAFAYIYIVYTFMTIIVTACWWSRHMLADRTAPYLASTLRQVQANAAWCLAPS